MLRFVAWICLVPLVAPCPFFGVDKLEALYDRVSTELHVQLAQPANTLKITETVGCELRYVNEGEGQFVAFLRAHPFWLIRGSQEVRPFANPSLVKLSDGRVAAARWVGRTETVASPGEGPSELEFFSFEVTFSDSPPKRLSFIIIYECELDDVGSIIQLECWPYLASPETPTEDVASRERKLTLDISSDEVRLISVLNGFRVKRAFTQKLDKLDLATQSPVRIIVNPTSPPKHGEDQRANK